MIHIVDINSSELRWHSYDDLLVLNGFTIPLKHTQDNRNESFLINAIILTPKSISPGKHPEVKHNYPLLTQLM